MFIRFKLEELQMKYSALFPGDGEDFPALVDLAEKTVMALRRAGFKARLYEVITNGLDTRVSAPDVPPETSLCLFIGDLFTKEGDEYLKKYYINNERIRISEKPLVADIVYDSDECRNYEKFFDY